MYKPYAGCLYDLRWPEGLVQTNRDECESNDAFRSVDRNAQSPPVMALTTAAISLAAVGTYAFLRTKTDDPFADARFVYRLLRAKREATAFVKRPEWSIVDWWEEQYVKGAPTPCVAADLCGPLMTTSCRSR